MSNGMLNIIERIWHHFQESAATLLEFAVLPVLKILVLCGFGLLMATSHINILNESSRKLLSKLVFSLFLPCLIFTQLGKAVTLHELVEWWFIPVNVVLGAILGCSLGYLVALVVQPPPQFFNFTVVMIGIGNIGNMPLVIIGAICRDPTNPFGLDPDTCNTKGVAYISFGQWVGAVIVYTFVFNMLAPPNTAKNSDIENKQLDDVIEQGTIGFVETPPVMDDYDAHLISVPLLQNHHSLKPVQGLGQLRKWFTHSTFVNDVFLQPPVVASLLALTIGCTPVLKSLIFEDHSVLFFFSDSLGMLGGAMVPCIMLVLGGNLVGGAGSSELGLRTTVTITLVRLFVVPLLGLAVVLTANTAGFLPAGDKLFLFVLLLQHTMPTSILAGAVANLRGHGAKEASAILFYEHTLAILSIAVWLILYINVLF